jgi:hypothetical protein
VPDPVPSTAVKENAVEESDIIEGVEVVEDEAVIDAAAYRLQETAAAIQRDPPPKRRPATIAVRQPAGDWPRVRAGLIWVLVATFIDVITWLLTTSDGQRLNFLVFSLEMAGSFTTLVGVALCLGAPARCGARGLAIASLLLTAVTLCYEVSLIVAALSISSSKPWLLLGLMLILGVLHVVQAAVFLFFLRAVSFICGEEGLAADIAQMMKLAGGLLLFSVFLMPMLILALGCIVIPIILAVLLLTLGCYIWYIVLLFRVRAAIPHGD